MMRGRTVTLLAGHVRDQVRSLPAEGGDGGTSFERRAPRSCARCRPPEGSDQGCGGQHRVNECARFDVAAVREADVAVIVETSDERRQRRTQHETAATHASGTRPQARHLTMQRVRPGRRRRGWMMRGAVNMPSLALEINDQIGHGAPTSTTRLWQAAWQSFACQDYLVRECAFE